MKLKETISQNVGTSEKGIVTPTDKQKEGMDSTAQEMHKIINSFERKQERLEYKTLPQFKRLGVLAIGIKAYLKREHLNWKEFFNGNFNKTEQRIIRESISAYRVLERFEDDKSPKGLSKTVATKLGQMMKSSCDEVKESADKLIKGEEVEINGKKFSLIKNHPTTVLHRLEKYTKKHSGRKKVDDTHKKTLARIGELKSLFKYLCSYDWRQMMDLEVLKREFKRMEKVNKLAKKIKKRSKELVGKLGDKISDIKNPDSDEGCNEREGYMA